MAVYVLELIASVESYRRLLEDPRAVGIPGELEIATATAGFHMHAFWPRDRVLHLIVEGDDHPDRLGVLLAERIRGRGWDPRWYRVFAAEDPPADVGPGDHSQWVIEIAVPPQFRECDICGWVGVPPHRPNGPCDRREDERLVSAGTGY